MIASLKNVQAVAVVDLGFGDAGKGLMVDALVRRLEAKLVVRFNGGAQAGHNVVVGDNGVRRHHTFAQLGSGSFVPGVRTHLAREVLIHPTALLIEARKLEECGVHDPLSRVSIDPNARVITPVQQAAGRLRELVRGSMRHGSCGVGIGETVLDSLEGRVLRARELSRPDLARFVLKQQKHKWIAMAAILRELRARAETREARDVLNEIRCLEEREPIDLWAEKARELASRITFREDDDAVGEAATRGERMIFEGAQGALLDETHGFHPYTTWSRCTFAPANEIASRLGIDLYRLGVVRMYNVRHGQGPLPTQDPALDVLPELHNLRGPWQGAVRRGWPDPPLLRYALSITHGADGLAVTHLDRRTRVASWQAATSYGAQTEIPFVAAPTLAEQEAHGRVLLAAKPMYEALKWQTDGDVVASFAAWTNVPVAFTSHGPTANDVRPV